MGERVTAADRQAYIAGRGKVRNVQDAAERDSDGKDRASDLAKKMHSRVIFRLKQRGARKNERPARIDLCYLVGGERSVGVEIKGPHGAQPQHAPGRFVNEKVPAVDTAFRNGEICIGSHRSNAQTFVLADPSKRAEGFPGKGPGWILGSRTAHDSWSLEAPDGAGRHTAGLGITSGAAYAFG